MGRDLPASAESAGSAGSGRGRADSGPRLRIVRLSRFPLSRSALPPLVRHLQGRSKRWLVVDAEKVDVDALSESLKALSNPKRLQLLRFLREPHYLEEIASELGMSRQAAQDHVSLLHEAGLLEKHAAQRPTGQVVEYRLVRARYFSLFEDLRILGATLPKSADEEALMRTVAGGGEAVGARADGPELVVIGGFRPGLRAPLHRGSTAPTLTLGRDPASGLLLDWDLMVSNRHAEVRGAAKGHVIVDLFSRNGTLVNGTRAQAGEPVPLRSGDVLQLGRTMLVYRD